MLKYLIYKQLSWLNELMQVKNLDYSEPNKYYFLILLLLPSTL